MIFAHLTEQMLPAIFVGGAALGIAGTALGVRIGMRLHDRRRRPPAS